MATLGAFLTGHATHPDWRVAVALSAAQIDAQRAAGPRPRGRTGAPTLGWVYFSDHYAPHARELLDDLRGRWPGVAWVGAVGVGICASGVEYFDEPAVTLMLAALPRRHFRVFSGARPLGDFAAHTAQVHADPATPDLGELITDMSDRTRTGYLFGGLAASRGPVVQFAASGHGNAPGQGAAGGVVSGGLSGVAFGDGVALVSRVTQGAQPVAPER